MFPPIHQAIAAFFRRWPGTQRSLSDPVEFRLWRLSPAAAEDRNYYGPFLCQYPHGGGHRSPVAGDRNLVGTQEVIQSGDC